MQSILIVKLGAMGDVLRTTPLLTALKRKHPEAKVTWVVDRGCKTVLDHNPAIDRLWVREDDAARRIAEETFDLAICLDKEPEALDCIEAANASVKKGFGWDADKKDVAPLNSASEYAVRLGIDDELKFRLNRKTYQQISYEQVEIPFESDDYVMHISDEDRQYAAAHLQMLGINLQSGSKVIGINTGSGERFAGKKLPEAHLIQLAQRLQVAGHQVLFLGGPEEKERNARLEADCAGVARNAGTHHSIHQFAAIVERLDGVITGDTIAMHIAIAARTPQVVYFGSTCEAEIELYSRGHKIISDLDCAPCYKRECPKDDKEACMKQVNLDHIMDLTQQLLRECPKEAATE